MRKPSVKTLATIFGDNAREARRILDMSREQLLELPACIARAGECYHPPQTWDLRMTALNTLGEFHGVEAIELDDNYYACDYLNAGDCYAPTLVRFRGNYYVWDIARVIEKHCNRSK